MKQHDDTCGRKPLDSPEGWDGCRRRQGHEGPCAHHYSGDFSTRRYTVHPTLRVVAAAARITFEGELVHDQARELIFSVPAPGRHHNIMYLAHVEKLELDTQLRHLEQGFLLSDGTFATRERALGVAKAANQIIRRCGSDEHALFSENVW